MLHGEAFGLLVGAVLLGAVHGVEPGHGWPIAASYALDQSNKWVYGFAASVIIGTGHLISSIAMVVACTSLAQVYVSKERMGAVLGTGDVRGIATATLLGATSSDCSFGAVTGDVERPGVHVHLLGVLLDVRPRLE